MKRSDDRQGGGPAVDIDLVTIPATPSSAATTAAAATGAATPLARLRDVSLRREGRVLIDGVSLELDERRIGIVGRNGSGKTTLARLLCGLIAPDAGTVRVGGVDVWADRKAALGQVGIIFQNPDHQIIFPTVGEEIAFGLRQQGRSRTEARARAREALARAGHADWEARAVATLSQGQRHLVCLMSVLAMAPRLIVLDEPFSGLDIPTTAWLRRHLDAAEPALVQISHDPRALEGYDRVIWLEAGRVEGDGPAGEVLADYEAAMRRIGGPDAVALRPG